VYVEVNGERKGSKRSLTASEPAVINLESSKNRIMIPANGSVAIDVMIDMLTTNSPTIAGNIHGLKVTAIQSGGSVGASLPIMGNTAQVSGVASPSAALTTSTVNSQVDIGDNQVEVGGIKIANTAAGNEHITVKTISLKNTGSASDSDASNYTLYDDTDAAIAGPVQMMSDKITFNFSPVEIEDGKSETYKVKADINDGRAETIIFGNDLESDLKGTGLINGFPVRFVNTVVGTIVII
jgi:hypothetical protein